MFSLLESPFQGLSLLPLMEPSITASLDLFAPFGSSPSNDKAQLKGSFGNAVLDNIPDYYSQLLTKVRVAAFAVCVRDVLKEQNFKTLVLSRIISATRQRLHLPCHLLPHLQYSTNC